MLAAMTNNQNFNDLDPEQQAAIAQAIQHQQQQMYQVDQNGVEEEDEGEDEVDIEYDGIEGMEQQIEDDGELMQNQGEDDMMDDEEKSDMRKRENKCNYDGPCNDSERKIFAASITYKDHDLLEAIGKKNIR